MVLGCDDLRLGGTLSATGITGGFSINGTAYSVTDWSSILGTPGLSGQQVEVFGRPGSYMAGDILGQSRYPNLNLAILEANSTGGLTAPTWQEQKQDNTDLFLGELVKRAGTYLELDMPDTTKRFLHVRNLAAAPISQPARLRTIRAPLTSDWPYWREGGNQSTDTISGADTMVVGGNVEVYDAVLVFAGDGTFTHSGLGWAIQVVGSSGAVTVDLGNRTVTQGGLPAENLIRRTVVAGLGRIWGWFTVGNNSVTSSASVTVTWRNQWV